MKINLPADYVQLGMSNLLYKTTLWVTIEYVLTSVYGVSPRQKM